MDVTEGYIYSDPAIVEAEKLFDFDNAEIQFSEPTTQESYYHERYGETEGQRWHLKTYFSPEFTKLLWKRQQCFMEHEEKYSTSNRQMIKDAGGWDDPIMFGERLTREPQQFPGIAPGWMNFLHDDRFERTPYAIPS